MIDSSYKMTGLPVRKDEIKFETYRFYLKCIADFMISTYNDWQSFAKQVMSKAERMRAFSNCDETYLDRFLKIAWNTEYLACENQLRDVYILRINNQWKPIQIYYAIYSAGEALSYLIDGNKSDSHKKCLRKISELLVKQKLTPWAFAYKGYRGKTKNDHSPVNFPSNLIIPHNLQRRNIQHIQMIAKCLKAEHTHRIDDNFQRQKGVFKYNFDPGYTTILHFLYRLRIKSNYKEADIFLAEAPDNVIIEFNKQMSNLCFWTLLLFEIYIIKKSGKKCFLKIFNNYMRINKNATILKTRIDFYRKYILK